MSVFGYGLEPFGSGPYGALGGVLLPGPLPPIGGYGGLPYGQGAYGATPSLVAPVIPVASGFGGSPYGHGPYGSLDSLPPTALVSVVSVTGFVLEAFFSNEMLADADLFAPSSYTLTPVSGAAPATVLSVEIGVNGAWGPTSLLLHHTGTTLGGLYTLTVVGPKDIGGTEISAYAPLNMADVLCKGEPPPYTVTPLSGTELLYQFEQDMLPEGSFSPGILQLDAYGFETDYPQGLIPFAVSHPYLGDPKQVKLDVYGMTSTGYTSVVSPTTAFDYPATYLPSAAVDFLVQELGTGTTVQGTDEVLLSTGIAFAYGWRFLDTSGRVQPGSSYRVDVSIDVSATVVNPAIGASTLLLVLVSDGAIEVDLSFKRLAGIDTIEVTSGAFSSGVAIAWSSGPTIVSVVHNQVAATFTIVVNGEPLLASPVVGFTGPAGFPPGVQFHVDPTGVYEVNGLALGGISFTSSQTVFSAAWNFLHNHPAFFIGSGATTRDVLLTQKGPLVKGWGDATPATAQDVAVYVNGIPVEVASVNPYYGVITMEIPIPLMPPGLMTVTVDYVWFPAPVMEFAGLNVLGLVLNKYDCRPLCLHGGNSSGVATHVGAASSFLATRFPMGVVLGPRVLRQPLLRSPRFVAFQKPYTAAFNSPRTLLLNQNPHRVARLGEQRMVEGTVVFYEGDEDPTEVVEPWTLVGINGPIDPLDLPAGVDADASEEGYFQIWKVVSGPYGVGEPGFYQQTIDLPSPSSIVLVVRFQLRTDGETAGGESLPITDGVFTGVGFGCHTDNHLYLVGALLINNVQHVGMLVKPAYPGEASSWRLAYSTPIQVLSATTCQTDSAHLPGLVRERLVDGDVVRFQVLEGPQAGVYVVEMIEDRPNGTSVLTIKNATFPEDPTVYGNRDCDAVFEVRWDGNGSMNRPSTYRLVVKHDIREHPKGYAELYVGGAYTGNALVLDGAPPFAIPPDGVLLYPTGERGEVFFGSLDRAASNLSDWYFVRYAVDPGVTTQNFRELVVAAEMTDLPEDDHNHVWFLTQEFGSRSIDALTRLLLKSTCADNEQGVEGLDLTIGYARIEPFLTRKLAIDVDVKFQLDAGVLGAGDLQFVIRDGTREVRVATLLFETTVAGHQLLALPNLSLSGLRLPDEQGWTKTADLSVARVQGQRLVFGQVAGETAGYAVDLVLGGGGGDGRIIEARIQVVDVVTADPAGDTGIFFGSDVGAVGTARGVGVELRVAVGAAPSRVVLFSIETGLEVIAYDAAWNDGGLHTFRVLASPDTDTVTMVFDDTVLGTVALTMFALSSTDTQASLGFVGATTTTNVVVEDFSVIAMAPLTARRTLGVYLGGDTQDIDSWRVPRTDTLDVPNTDVSALIVDMDWRSLIKARIHRDPGWGVTLLRPDLPPPPWFTGNFATDFTQPSAGWINVEYPDLPRVTTDQTLGFVAFGSLYAASIMQARINEVRYRIYRYASENQIAPPHMVLNQYNVITSGEIQRDVTVESVTVLSRDSQTLDLTAGNITADRIFSLSFVNAEGRTVTYLPRSFTFDTQTQIVKLTTLQTFGYYPSQDVPDDEDSFVDNPSLNSQTFPLPLPVLLDPLAPDFLPDSAGYPLDTRVPVTVNFAPGYPLTKTYLCTQPLLDGTTLLNEGTPSYETAQVGRDVQTLAWGSRINDPTDTLNNDPDFIFNDPFRYLDFTGAETTQYELLDTCEVSEGETCWISPFCDTSVPGAAQAGASWNEPGDIGNGLIGFDFSGLSFTEIEPIGFVDGPVGGFGAPLSSVFLKASGGVAPPGGNLNDAILFTPLGPQAPSFEDIAGAVGWSVFGQLYDTVAMTTTILFFGTGP